MLSYTRKDVAVTTPKSPTKKYARKESDYTPPSTKGRQRVYSEKIATDNPKEDLQTTFNGIKTIGSARRDLFGASQESSKAGQTNDTKKVNSIQEIKSEETTKEFEPIKSTGTSNPQSWNSEKDKNGLEEAKRVDSTAPSQYDRQFLLNFIKKQSSLPPIPEIGQLIQRKSKEVGIMTVKKNYTQDFSQKKNGDGKYNRKNEKSDSPKTEESASPTLNPSKLTPVKKYNEDSFIRKEMSEEEKAAKARIEGSLGKWSNQILSKSEDEALEKKIRFLLNLLTPDNYEKVRVDIRDAAQTSVFASKKLAELLIEKAWGEVKYSKIYAKLCEYLGKCDKLNFDQPDQSVPGDKKRNEFKIYLIRKIQSSFNNDSQITPKTSKKVQDMNSEEKELYQMKKKKLIIGNVVFISELFLRNFISRKVILICISSLLTKFFNEFFDKSPKASADEKTPENHLDALIVLLTHAGKAVEDRQRLEEMQAGNTSPKKVDLTRSNSKQDKTSGADNTLCKDIETAIKSKQKEVRLPIDNFRIADVIESLNLLKEKLDLSVRIGSLVQNLDQRRQNGWVAPEFLESGPKTLKQVELDFLKEKIPTSKPIKKAEVFNNDQSPRIRPNLNLFVTRTQSSPANQSFGWKLESKSLIPVKSDSTHGVVIQEENNASSSLLTLEEVITDLKEIYKLVADDEVLANILERFRRLSEKAGDKEFTMGLLKSFNDGTLQQVSKRLEVFPKLMESDIIDKDIFNKSYGECLFDLWLEASDFPGIEVNYAKIYVQMVSLGKLTFKGLYIHPSLKTSEEKEFIVETYNTVIAEMQNLVKNQYTNLDKKTQEIEDLKKLINEF